MAAEEVHIARLGAWVARALAASGSFAADLDTLTIEELLLPVDTYVKSFGVDASGEIYLLGGINLGPFTGPNGETFGAIYRIDAVPLPAAVWMLASALGVLGLRRKFTV